MAMPCPRPTLMGLSREIRDSVYEYVWSDFCYVRVAYHVRAAESTARGEPAIPDLSIRSKEHRPPLEQDTCVVDSEESLHSTERSEINETVKGWRNPPKGIASTHASLLLVNWQLSAEAALVYYRKSTFVLDMNGDQATKYLEGLSDIARTNITSLALTSKLLYDKKIPLIQAWSGDKEKPLYRKDGVTLITPFATLLSETLPRLSEVFFHVPVGGRAKFYCGWATRELHMMLKHGRIQRLSHVFNGRRAAGTVESDDSQEFYKRLMGPLADGGELAQHEFEMERPLICVTHGDGMEKQRAQQWVQAREEFVKKHARPFTWESGDCGIEMYPQQSVLAVITCSIPA